MNDVFYFFTNSIGAYRSDIIRQLLLYRYGGIYNDISINYISKINEFVSENDQFVVTTDKDPFGLWNGFISAYAEHPIIKKIIIATMDNVIYRRYGYNNLDITGPHVCGKQFNQYFNRTETAPIHPGIYKFYNQLGLLMKVDSNIHSKLDTTQTEILTTPITIVTTTTTANDAGTTGTTNVNKAIQKGVGKLEFEQIKVLDTLRKLRHKISNKRFHVYMNRNEIKNLLYANSTYHAPYYELYDKYLVYKNDTRHNKLKFAEGKIVHIPLLTTNIFDIKTSKYWYIHNGTRWGFPNYEIFLMLGFDILKSIELPSHIIHKIPLKQCFSKDIKIAKNQLQNFIYLPNYLNQQRSINKIKLNKFLIENKGKVVRYIELFNSVEI